MDNSAAIPHGEQGKTVSNWAQIESCQPELYFQPSNVEELRSILQSASELGKKVRVSGGMHSFERLIHTDGWLLDMRKMDNILEVDKAAGTVETQPGVTLRELNRVLGEQGLSLTTMPVVEDATIGGIVATASHGSGSRCQVVSAYVTEVELMTADGTMMRCSQEHNGDIFKAACCSLGCVGVVTSLTLRCEPDFVVEEVKSTTSFETFLNTFQSDFEESDYYSALFFSDTVINVKSRRSHHPPDPVIEKSTIGKLLSMIFGFLFFHFLQFLNYLCIKFPCLLPFVNWFILQQYKGSSVRNAKGRDTFVMPGLPLHRTSEWAIDIQDTAKTMKKLKKWLDGSKTLAINLPLFIRFVRKDDVWLSFAYGRDTCLITIIMYMPYGNGAPHENTFEEFKNIMLEVGGRPHWAKCTETLDTYDFQRMYVELERFKEIRSRLDPDLMFTNEYVQNILGE